MNNKNLALANYTKATQIDSTNHLAYFYRAKLYEKVSSAFFMYKNEGKEKKKICDLNKKRTI